MNKGIYYFLFAVVVIGSMIIYFKIQRTMRLDNPQLSDLALEPDLLMSTADRNFQDYKSITAINFLEDAIATMKFLEKNGDSISTNAIEVAIHDLEVVEYHIKAKDIDNNLMYEAFADAMNSLAYASLRVSEQYIRDGKTEEAKIAIHYAMDHLQNSIKFARGKQKEDEMKIASHLQKIIKTHLENHTISDIDKVMSEIDEVVKAHVIQ